MKKEVKKEEMPLPQDGRGFWMLPQGPEDGGFYNYGNPINGAAQYCHPRLLELIFAVGFKWRELDERRFGVGNASLAYGIVDTDHRLHMDGLKVDVRALRKDGRDLPVSHTHAAYDRIGTAALIKCFFDTGLVLSILFNDLKIPRVKFWEKHDDHIHVVAR